MLMSCSRWRVVVALIVMTGAICLWWSWALRPLQRWYFWPYLNCALQGSAPGIHSEVHWLYKTARGRKPALATDQDVVSSAGKRGSSRPIRLSATARKRGWTGLVSGEEEWIEIRRLQPFLRQEFYGGQTLLRMLLTPLLWSIGALLCLFAVQEWMRIRRSRIDRYWRREPPSGLPARCGPAIRSLRSASMKITKALIGRRRSTPAPKWPDTTAGDPRAKSSQKTTSLFGAASRTPGERLGWKPTEQDRLM